MARQSKEMYFVALGGIGEIGMNLYAYGYGPEDQRQWIIVDMGIAFANGFPPGVDIIVPDISFLANEKNNVVAIFLTHAHEDHIGSIQLLWDQIEAPIYTSSFTASLVKRKFKERYGDLSLLKNLHIDTWQDETPIRAEKFVVTPLSVNHSTIEASALLIETPAGKIFHSGDWRFDSNPVIGKTINEERLKAIGDSGVLAYVGDSTNALVEEDHKSESDVFEDIKQLISEAEGCVFITCFASNVSRMATIAKAAKECGKIVASDGSSVSRIEEEARKHGYLQDYPKFIPARKLDKHTDRSKLVVICTGSQGESRAALSRLTFANSGNFSPKSGDYVLFSSKIIPGNEKNIHRIQNELARKNVHVFSNDTHLLHVSGHPSQNDIKKHYQLLRPTYSLPVHGEYRMLKAHKDIAFAAGCKDALIAENGAFVSISKDYFEISDEVWTSRLSLEGDRLVAFDNSLIRNRTRALREGIAVVTIAMDVDGNMVELPKITSIGLIDDDEMPNIRQDIATLLDNLFDEVDDDIWDSNSLLTKEITKNIRKYLSQNYGTRPIVSVHLVRLED